MSGNFEIINMNMKMGMALSIEGRIHPDTDSFEINVGEEKDVVKLHFNPRFDQATIVCNWSDGSKQGQEQRDNPINFCPRPILKFIIAFQENKVKVILGNGHVIFSLNWPGDKDLHYLSIKGVYVSSFKLKSQLCRSEPDL